VSAAGGAAADHPLVDAAQDGHDVLLAREDLGGDACGQRLAEEERERVEREVGATEAPPVPQGDEGGLEDQVHEEVRDEEHGPDHRPLLDGVGPVERIPPEDVERRHDEEDERNDEYRSGAPKGRLVGAAGIPSVVREPRLVGMEGGQLLGPRRATPIHDSRAGEADAQADDEDQPTGPDPQLPAVVGPQAAVSARGRESPTRRRGRSDEEEAEQDRTAPPNGSDRAPRPSAGFSMVSTLRPVPPVKRPLLAGRRRAR
jgi:hypothetical protein